MRPDLKEEKRRWSTFEVYLFNLITKAADREIPGYFSTRLEVCNEMLKAYDKKIEELEAEFSRRTKKDGQINRK